MLEKIKSYRFGMSKWSQNFSFWVHYAFKSIVICYKITLLL